MTGLTLARTDDIVIGIVLLILFALLAYRHLRAEAVEGPSADGQLHIDKLIEQVKQDLEAADEKRIRENKAALFKTETFDLDINFVVRQTASANAQLSYEVVTVGGKSEISAEKVQRISLHFKAVDYGKEDADIKASGEFKPLKGSRSSPESEAK